MRNQHLIAVDLDGTLLTDQKTISVRTKTALQKAREQGHIVVIATGRPYRSSYMYHQELQLDTAIVNFNGAYIHHPADSSFGTYHTPMPLDTAKEIITTCASFGITDVYAEVIDDLYVRRLSDSMKHFFTFGTPKVYTGDLLHILDKPPTCLLIDAKEENVASIRSHLSNIHAEVIDHRRWAAPYHVIEIVKSGINKAVGLQKLSDYYNIPQERMIAFGDEDNDFEMIEFAGHGIAMGNAIDALKERANDVTLTNEEDGVAIYLEKLLKL